MPRRGVASPRPAPPPRVQKKAAEKERKTERFIVRHRKGIGIAVALFLVLAFFLNALTSCSVLVEGGLSGVGLTTYPSADEDLKGAE